MDFPHQAMTPGNVQDPNFPFSTFVQEEEEKETETEDNFDHGGGA